MGSKSSDAPQADPQLVAAQLRTMGVQESALEQVMALATQQQAQNAELLPLQKQQMQIGIDSANEAITNNRTDREWLVGRRDALGGLQDSMVTEAQSFNTEAAQEQRGAAAAADMGKVLSNQDAATARTMAAMGVAPDSGRFATRDGADRARMIVGAQNEGRLAARNEGRALTDRATNALAGYPAQVSGATGQGASLGGNAVGVTGAGVGGINSTYGAGVGSYGAGSAVAGQLGAGATNMWNAQATNKANADTGAGSWMGELGSLLGGGAAAYGAYSKFASSDRRLKTNITAVGSHEKTGLTIYEFEYKAAPGQRFRGVMADEVEKVYPGAVHRDSHGFASVHYGAIGVPFERV